MADISAFDFFKQPINVGDTVAFMQLGYRCLRMGKVIKITPMMVVIEHEQFDYCSTQTKQYHGQIIVKK